MAPAEERRGPRRAPGRPRRDRRTRASSSRRIRAAARWRRPPHPSRRAASWFAQEPADPGGVGLHEGDGERAAREADLLGPAERLRSQCSAASGSPRTELTQASAIDRSGDGIVGQRPERGDRSDRAGGRRSRRWPAPDGPAPRPAGPRRTRDSRRRTRTSGSNQLNAAWPTMPRSRSISPWAVARSPLVSAIGPDGDQRGQYLGPRPSRVASTSARRWSDWTSGAA